MDPKSAGTRSTRRIPGLLSRGYALDESVRLVRLESTGRVFCAGGDVRAMAAAREPSAYLDALAEAMHGALSLLRSLPIPVLAVVQGAAAGAGLGLVLAADIVTAADTAKFVTAYGSIGSSPDCGVTALLPSVVGVRRAALMALTGRVVSAREALEWGLITEIWSPADLTAHAMAISQQIVSTLPHASGQTARLLREQAGRSYDQQLDDEARSIALVSRHPATVDLIKGFR